MGLWLDLYQMLQIIVLLIKYLLLVGHQLPCSVIYIPGTFVINGAGVVSAFQNLRCPVIILIMSLWSGPRWFQSSLNSGLFVCLFVCFKPASYPSQLSCCGIQSYTNWSTSPYFFKHGIPTSCCMNSSDCNTQDLRNMTVAATKVNQKVPVTLCQRHLWHHPAPQGTVCLLALAFHFKWLVDSMQVRLE